MGLQAVAGNGAAIWRTFPDQSLQDLVDKIGYEVVLKSAANTTDWQYGFIFLRFLKLLNAFALPGGQVFITYALLSRLESNAQLAGVLGHEVGDTLLRVNSAQRKWQSKT